MLTQTPLVQTPGLSAHSFTSAGGKGCPHGVCHFSALSLTPGATHWLRREPETWEQGQSSDRGGRRRGP